MPDDEETSAVLIGADGHIELSEGAAKHMVSHVSLWAIQNPGKAALVAGLALPSYLRLRAAQLRRRRFIGLIGTIVELTSDRLYERMREAYGPSDGEVADDTWQQHGHPAEPPEHGPN